MIEKITPQTAAMYIGQKCETIIGDGVIDAVFHSGKICVQHEKSVSILFQENVTPHLRRLESMTEEEARDLCEVFYGPPVREKKIWSHLDFLFKSIDGAVGPVIGSMIGSPAVWLYLLSKGFDLFGLIDAGLAKEI